MTNKKCEGIDCAWCMSIECPTKESKMADKEQVTNSKEQIMIDGEDVTQFNSDELACMNRYDVARLFIGLVENLHRKTQECEHYRKALEEIEEVINNILNSCLGRNTVSCRPAHNVCGDLINILDIINKAKGGEDER